MSRIFYIQDVRGERRADDSVMAYIALADGHAYLQPADPSYPLFHNHQRVTESTWLKSGDQLQIGEAVLVWTVKGDQVYQPGARLCAAATDTSGRSTATAGAGAGGYACGGGSATVQAWSSQAETRGCRAVHGAGAGCCFRTAGDAHGRAYHS